MGCGPPLGGLVSAVLYAREEHGVRCRRSAHVAIAISLVFFFWSLIVCGSSTSLRSAVRMTSNASCFALLNRPRGWSWGARAAGYSCLGGNVRVRRLVPCAFFTVTISPLDPTPLHSYRVPSRSSCRPRIRTICAIDVACDHERAAQ